MSAYYNSLPKEVQGEALKYIGSIIENFKMLGERNSILFMRELIRHESSEIEKEASCRKGCSACCHINVDVSHKEAQELLPYVTDDMIPTLKKQASKSKTPQSYMQVPFAERKCVFLKDGECSVYDIRPLNCRKYYVANDPKFCDTSEQNFETQVIASGKIELAMDAFAHLYKGGNLSKKLLKLKK